jgi:hypothetical protein
MQGSSPGSVASRISPRREEQVLWRPSTELAQKALFPTEAEARDRLPYEHRRLRSDLPLLASRR